MQFFVVVFVSSHFRGKRASTEAPRKVMDAPLIIVDRISGGARVSKVCM